VIVNKCIVGAGHTLILQAYFDNVVLKQAKMTKVKLYQIFGNIFLVLFILSFIARTTIIWIEVRMTL